MFLTSEKIRGEARKECPTRLKQARTSGRWGPEALPPQTRRKSENNKKALGQGPRTSVKRNLRRKRGLTSRNRSIWAVFRLTIRKGPICSYSPESQRARGGSSWCVLVPGRTTFSATCSLQRCPISARTMITTCGLVWQTSSPCQCPMVSRQRS